MPRKKSWIAGWLTVLLFVATGVFVASCEYFQPAEVAFFPPQIEGAEYVGMETCEPCHPEQAREFSGAPHAAFTINDGQDASTFSGEGCETCHGPGSLHVESRGDKSKILMGDWEACVRCHMDKRAKFRMRFHHPVPEGRMSCTDCHDPHKGQRAVRWAEHINETCFECHPDKKGPWTFPHDAVTEDGCVVCHDPHGSNVDKMLIATPDVLCLRCHVQSDHPNIGTSNHGSRLGRGGCHNCHRGLHGSNFSEHLRYP